MLRSPRNVTVNIHQVEIKEGPFELELAEEHNIIGIAPPREPRNDVLRDDSAQILVQEHGSHKRTTKFRFVRAGNPFQVSDNQSCLGSVWSPEDRTLYLLIGVGQPPRMGGAC